MKRLSYPYLSITYSAAYPSVSMTGGTNLHARRTLQSPSWNSCHRLTATVLLTQINVASNSNLNCVQIIRDQQMQLCMTVQNQTIACAQARLRSEELIAEGSPREESSSTALRRRAGAALRASDPSSPPPLTVPAELFTAAKLLRVASPAGTPTPTTGLLLSSRLPLRPCCRRTASVVAYGMFGPAPPRTGGAPAPLRKS